MRVALADRDEPGRLLRYRPSVLVRPAGDEELRKEWVVGSRRLLDLTSWDLRMLYGCDAGAAGSQESITAAAPPAVDLAHDGFGAGERASTARTSALASSGLTVRTRDQQTRRRDARLVLPHLESLDSERPTRPTPRLVGTGGPGPDIVRPR